MVAEMALLMLEGRVSPAGPAFSQAVEEFSLIHSSTSIKRIGTECRYLVISVFHRLDRARIRQSKIFGGILQ
jgi:hypothetical protein